MMLKLALPLVFLIVVFIAPVLADGGIIIYDPDMYWGMQDIDQQLCIINYEAGFENMLLSIHINDLQGEKAVWIFPVPAKTDETAIDVIKGFPRLIGYNLKERVEDTVSDNFDFMNSSIFGWSMFKIAIEPICLPPLPIIVS